MSLFSRRSVLKVLGGLGALTVSGSASGEPRTDGGRVETAKPDTDTVTLDLQVFRFELTEDDSGEVTRYELTGDVDAELKIKN